MQRAHAAGHVAIGRAREARIADHAQECFLIRKPADGFDQISVRICVVRQQFPQRRDRIKRIEIINRLEPANGEAREFQAIEPSAGLQDAPRLAQHLGDVGAVPDAEADDVGVGGGIIDGQVFGIALVPIKPCFTTRAAGFEHLGVDVDDMDFRRLHAAPLSRPVAKLFKPARDVARAARHVEDELARLRVELGRRRVFPKPVQPARHGVVHQVVFRGDRRKHLAYARGLLSLRHVLESKGCSLITHGADHSGGAAAGLYQPHMRTCLFSGISPHA